MTTVVVTKKNGIACIAADTLATYGDTEESADLVANSDKLVRVGDAWAAPTGPASAQLVIRHFAASYEELPHLEDVDGIFDFLTQFQRALRDEYFVHGKEDGSDDFESMRMEILIASPGGIFGCYPERSVQEFTKYYAFGSGAEYALGAMRVAWETSMNAEEIARVGIETAAKFDVGTGLPMTLRSIPLHETASTPGLFEAPVLGAGAPGGHAYGSSHAPIGQTNGGGQTNGAGPANGAGHASGAGHERERRLRGVDVSEGRGVPGQ